MRLAPALVLILAACSGKKEPAPSPSEARAPAPASEVAVVTDAAEAPAVDRFRTLVMPEVAAGVRPEPFSDGPIVSIAMLQIAFEGAPVARVMGGRVDPKARDARGVITALSQLHVAYMKAMSPPPPRTNVAVVPQLASRVLFDVLQSLDDAGAKRVALMVRTSEGVGVLETGTFSQPIQAGPPRVIVAVERDQVRLWAPGASSDGAPLATVARSRSDVWAALRTAAEARRGEEVAVLAADDVPARDLVDALVAVSRDGTGQPLLRDGVVGRWTPPPPGVAADHAALEDEAARYADLLALPGDSSDNVLSGEIGRTAPGSDLAAQIEAIRDSGAQVATGGAGSRSDRAYADVLFAEDDDPPKGPAGRIQLRDKRSFDETSLTADVLARKLLSAYMPGLKRCYRRALESDPTLQGRLGVDLTVNERGQVEKHGAHSSSSTLDTCVDGLLASWRFNVPKDVDGEATEASFKLTFELTPE